MKKEICFHSLNKNNEYCQKCGMKVIDKEFHDIDEIIMKKQDQNWEKEFDKLKNDYHIFRQGNNCDRRWFKIKDFIRQLLLKEQDKWHKAGWEDCKQDLIKKIEAMNVDELFAEQVKSEIIKLLKENGKE